MQEGAARGGGFNLRKGTQRTLLRAPLSSLGVVRVSREQRLYSVAALHTAVSYIFQASVFLFVSYWFIMLVRQFSVLLVGGSSLLLALELLDFQLWEASALAAATLLLARRLLIWMARGEHLARAWVLVPVTLLCSPLFFVLLNVEELRWRRTLAAVSPVLGRGLGLSAAASVLLANSVTLCLLWRKLE